MAKALILKVLSFASSFLDALLKDPKEDVENIPTPWGRAARREALRHLIEAYPSAY